MKEPLSIKEFGTITIGSSHKEFETGELEIDQDTFNSLAIFIEENQTQEDFDKAFSLFQKKGKRYIKVKNYVGVIETRNGCIIEILPKTYFGKIGAEANKESSKKILFTMLRTLKDSPFINLSTATLKERTNFPIIEIFISSYLDELAALTSRELRGDYVQTTENQKFVKGKLLFNENLNVNLFDKSSFYCQFDEFNVNIPPNKLIKSTLLRLKDITTSILNKKKILKSLHHFYEVNSSSTIDTDLAYCHSRSRSLINYGNLLNWSEIFLKNKSFTNFHGNTINQAILFPMEKLFESYIISLLRKNCFGLSVKAHDKRYYLLSQKINNEENEFPIKKFLLKPDVVLNESEIIIDTKWKILNSLSIKYDIKEADIYQMHAYGIRYSENLLKKPRLALIYPKNPNFEYKLPQFRFGEDLYLDVLPFDFGNEDPLDEVSRILNALHSNKALYKIIDDELSEAADNGV